MTMTPGRLLAFAALTLTACDSRSSPQPFNYDLTRSSAIDIEAHDASGPLRGVVVSVRAPSSDPDTAGALLWMGATGSDGHARALIRTDGAGASLDVTLHKAGRRGPWTDEALRAQQGVTAPSARLVVPISQTQSMHVDLERSE